MNKIDYVFNVNDGWADDVDYIIQLIEDLELETIEIGERVPVLHKDIFNLIYLKEEMQEQAYEIADEYAEDYLKDLTTEKAKELEDLILVWLNENIEQPNFFTVKNEKEISVQEFRERFL
jgi:deoxyribose-phosphate aldolase